MATLPIAPSSTISIFALSESLGINENALVDAFTTADRDPLKALQLLQDVRHAADQLERYAVSRVRPRQRWDDVAQALGMSRQAARKRHPDVE